VTRWLFEAAADLYGWMTAQSAWQQSCRRLAERLPAIGAPLRVVDLGCGTGASALELARLRPEDSVSGVDIAWRMLRRARRHATATPNGAGRLAWVQADATRLPFRAGSIDAVTGHSVLYLVADRRAVLDECLRVLRPGGRLIVMEPNDQPVRVRDVLTISADPRFLLSIALWRAVSGLHGRLAPESLEATLRAAGFARCQVSEALSGLGVWACAQKASPAGR
jgi:ubiquinone/menaquinone biosynthesis C-methylase UbiE